MDTLQLVFGVVVILKRNYPKFDDVQFVLKEDKDKHAISGEFLGVYDGGWHSSDETDLIHEFVGLSELQDIINLYIK